MQSFFKNLTAALPEVGPTTADLKGKVAVIVGGAHGTGLAMTRHFAKLGCRVIVISTKDANAANAITKIRSEPGQADVKIEVVECDLEDLKATREAIRSLESTLPRLDLLVLCSDTKSESFSLTPDQIDSHFSTNALIPLLITNLFFPLLKRTAAMPDTPKGSVRIVYESSDMHHFTPGSSTSIEPTHSAVHFGSELEINEYGKSLNAIELYGRGKLALILYAKVIADKQRKNASQVTVTSFHASSTTEELEKEWNKLAIGPVLKGMHNLLGKKNASPAYPAFYAALSKEIVEKNWSGEYFTDVAQQGKESAQAKDMMLAQAAWELSHRMIRRVVGDDAVCKDL